MALEEQLADQEQNPYDALIREGQDQRTTQLRESVREGAKASPDARAEAIKLADQYAMPVDLVERNLDFYRQRAIEDLPDVDRMIRQSPKLADWLSQQPALAGAARDDLAQLQELEKTVSFASSFLRGVDITQGMGFSFLEWAGEASGAEDLAAFGKEGRERNTFEAGEYGRRAQFTEIKGFWDLAQWLKETAGEQIPIMAPSLAGAGAGATTGGAIGSAFPIIGTAVGVTVGGLLGAFIPSFVLGVGETQQTLKEKDPFAEAPLEVFLGGSAVAALDSALPGKVGGRLVRTFGRETAEEIAKRALLAPVKPKFLRRAAGEAITGMATEGVTEALQSAISEIAAARGADTSVDWRQLRTQMIEEGAAGAVMGGGANVATEAVTIRRQQARFAAAQQQKEIFDLLAKGVTDSKLMARLPEKAREFLQLATRDGAVETVYAPVQQFEEYWASKGISPAVMAAELTGRADALEHAKQVGSDLAIPTADYATKIAATEHHAFFAGELKLRPDLLNIRETKELEEQFQVELAAAAAATTPDVDASVEEIRRRVHADVVGAGYTDENAARIAQLVVDRERVSAHRLGVDPLQHFEQRPLRIVLDDDGLRLTPTAPAAVDRPLDIPASRGTRGETRAQRDVRYQGHVAAMAAALARDATQIDPDVDPAQIRAELEFRLSVREQSRQDVRDAGGDPVDLLRAIAAAGGLAPESEGGLTGELRLLRESAGKFGSLLGVQHVFRSKRELDDRGQPSRGLGFDVMLQRLQQDARFAHLETTDDLIDAIDQATRTGASEDVFPGTDELRELGIRTGTKWWADSWRGGDPVDTDADQLVSGQLHGPLAQPAPMPNAKGETAYFLGWQEGFGDIPALPLYNVIGGDLNGSTVTPDNLDARRIPYYAQQLPDSVDTGGDVSFNPDEFSQIEWDGRTLWYPKPELVEDVAVNQEQPGAADVARLEEELRTNLERVPSEKSQKSDGEFRQEATPQQRIESLDGRVPFPQIDDAAAERLWLARDEASAKIRSVPIALLTATQPSFQPAIALDYATSTDPQPPPPALFHNGRFYLADGHHRAIAAWANGEASFTVSAMTVDAARLVESLQDESGRELLGPGGYIGGDVSSRALGPRGRELAEQHQALMATKGAVAAAYSEKASRAAARPDVDDEFYQLNDRNTPQGFEVVAPHLAPEEAGKLRRDTAQRLLDIWETLPSDRDFQDAAVAGAAKRGWYERSTQAIKAVFGEVDSVRFTALLAALSPQTSVQTNLLNAVRMWVNWTDEGRPTDKRSIAAILRRSVRGAQVGTGDSVLPSWVNNVVRALKTEDPYAIVLSGPKVQSFTRNLWGHLHEVTLDAWMANFALLDQQIFAGELQGAGLDPGKGPGYLAFAAKLRRVADTLTRETGVEWTPAHVQETVWSFTKTLYELAEAEGASAVKLLKEGKLTDAAIVATPDFERLFTEDASVREILEAAGYGEVLSAIEKGIGRSARSRDAAAQRARAGARRQGVTPGLIRAARRLDELKRRRVEQAEQKRLERILDAQPKLKAARRAARTRTSTEFFQQEQPPSRVDELEQLATDEAMGVTWNDDGQSLFPDGAAAVVCTNCAERIIELAGGGQVYGWEEGTNPTSIVAGPTMGARLDDGQGHDFAVIDDRYLVDAWAKNVEGSSERAAFDLQNPADVDEVLRLYGDVSTWLRRTKDGWTPAIPGALKQAPSDEFHQLEGFHSRIVRAVQTSPQAKASGAQWKATIKNRGVNLEEWQALAIDKLEDGLSYTREELLEHLVQHEIHVQERTLSEQPFTDQEVADVAGELYEAEREKRLEQAVDTADFHSGEATAQYDEAEEHWIAMVDGEDVGPAYYDTEDEAFAVAEAERERRAEQALEELRIDIGNELEYGEFEDEAEEQLRERYEGENAQFREFQMPGADEGSYREVFLTAPGAKGSPPAARRKIVLDAIKHWKRQAEHPDFSPQQQQHAAELEQIWRDVLASTLEGDWRVSPTSGFRALHRGANDRLLEDDGDRVKEIWRAGSGSWTDGHDEYENIENPVVRIRLNTRRSVTGETTLFLEEVQPPIPDHLEKMPALLRNHWRELAFKWALRHAAVNGYHRLAWTSGAMQVKRYDLRQAADRIEYYPRSQQLAAYRRTDTGGFTEVYRKYDVAPEQLETYVGKELATRILATPTDLTTGSGLAHILTGDELAVGGEGLARLYDKDFRDVVNKLVKKHGAKVAQLEVPFGKDAFPLPANFARNLALDDRLAEWHKKHPPTDALRAVPGVVITPQLLEAYLGEQALFQDEPPPGWTSADTGSPESPDPLLPGPATKGAYRPSARTIRLVAGKADFSTLLHELGHDFLEQLVLDALTVGPEHQVRRDAETALRGMGYQGTLEAWQRLPVDAQRDVHERWARTFEQYLTDGKAPSPELRELFARFRAWLVAVYRGARGLGIDIAPEIRGVMDRMLATDDAIANAEAEANMSPLFTDAASAGVSPEIFAEYQAQVREASRLAREAVDMRMMREWRREREAWWQNERELVYAAVREEVHSQPVYIALSVMRTGKMPDGRIPDFGDGRALKLSKQALVAEFGPDILKRLPRPYIYQVEGGLTAQHLAELTGFGSGDALIQAIIAAPAPHRIIDAETDRRMRERHGDLLLDGMSLREVAEAAVHEHRAAVIAAELRALTAGMTRASLPNAEALNAAARERIARTKVRELKPGLYLQASRRASKQAFEALGANDRAAAIRAKQQELLSLALYREAIDAKQRAQSMRDGVMRFTKPAARQRVGKAGGDFLDQLDGFLDRYEFSKVPQQVLDRRKSLRAWVQQLGERGLPVDLPEEVLDDARRTNYLELTVEELQGVYDAVQQIAHLARVKNRLLKAAEKRELAEIRGEVSTTIRLNAPARRERSIETELPSEKLGQAFEGWAYAHRKMAELAFEMDGGTHGPLWEYVIRRVNEALDDKTARVAKATTAISALFDQHYTASERTRFFRKEHIPALGDRSKRNASLSKMGRLTVALNWGNETNRQRLRDGHGWTDQQVQAILDTLDRRDWQFVQDVWDHINSYWPEIAEKQRRVVGVAPEKVEPTSVFTRYGEFRGGYFPLKYNRQLSAKAGSHEEAGFLELQKAAAYALATTKRNHTKPRAEGEVVRPLRLDFGVITEHLGEVIHDLTHHEMLTDVGRILEGDVSQAIVDTYGAEALEVFRKALRDQAVGEEPAREWHDKLANHIRSGVTIVGLGWNFVTPVLQLVGFTNSARVVGMLPLAKAIAQVTASPMAFARIARQVRADSKFMNHRALSMNRELNEIRNKIGLGTSRADAWFDFGIRAATFDKVTRDTIVSTYFSMIGAMQSIVDVPTYWAAYQAALEDPLNVDEQGRVDKARAIALGDQAVRDAQGSGEPAYLAAVQRGSAWKKLWTNFMSIFNVNFNLWVRELRAARRGGYSVPALGDLAVGYALLFIIPPVLSNLVREGMKGELGDDDDAEKLLLEWVNYQAGSIFVLRDVVSAISGPFGFEGPTGTRPLATATRAGKTLVKAIAEGDLETIGESAIRATAQTAGALLHVPTSAMLRAYDGITAWANGESSNPLAPLVGVPKE